MDNQTDKAGKDIAELFKRPGPIAIEDINSILAADLESEYALRISSRDLTELVELKNTAVWPKMVQWFVYGDLHIPMHSGPTLHFIGYQENGGVPRRELKRHISDRLTLQPNLFEMESILVREWDSTFTAYTTKNRGPANYGVLGSEVKLESLQYVVAISLAYTGLLFLFAVIVRLETLTARTPSDPPVNLTYPDYGRFQTSAQELDFTTGFMCSSLWWSFVCAPVLLLSLGVLYRYVMPIGNSPIFSLLGIAMVVKIPDDFSLACDVINLICLCVCLVSVFMLENLKERPRLPSKFQIISGLVGGGALFSLILTYGVIARAYGQDYNLRAFYVELALVFIWLGVTFYSAWRGHRGIWNVSIVCLTAYAALGLT